MSLSWTRYASLSNFCKINQLFLNDKKTKCLIFNNKKKISFTNQIMIDNNPIDILTEYKYLGFVIDNNLSNVIILWPEQDYIFLNYLLN